MPTPFATDAEGVDLTLRHVAHRLPEALARALLPDARSLKQLVWGDTHLNARERRLDESLRLIADGVERIEHVERQMLWTRLLAFRVLEHHALLTLALHQSTPLNKPVARVRSTVVLLQGIPMRAWPSHRSFRTTPSDERFSGLCIRVEPVYQRTVQEQGRSRLPVLDELRAPRACRDARRRGLRRPRLSSPRPALRRPNALTTPCGATTCARSSQGVTLTLRMNDASHLALLTERPRIGAWRIAHVAGGLRGTLHLRLTRDDGAWVRCIVGSRGEQGLVQTRAGSVYYKDFHGCSDGEAAEATRALGAALDEGAVPLAVLFPHLAMHATPTEEDRLLLGATLHAQAKLLGSGEGPARDLVPSARSTLYFDPPGVAEFLAPELTVGGAPIAGCSLRAIYLPPVGRRQAVDFGSLVLEFEREGELHRLRLSVGGREGFGRVGTALSLDVMGVTGELDGMALGATSLASWLLTLLRLKGAEELVVTVPTRAEELRALNFPLDRAAPSSAWSGTSAPGAEPSLQTPPALNLAIDSDCHQACAFCSVKSYVKPSDGGADELANIRFQLRSAREQGVDEVRLNGIDPLTFSRVLDVVSAVREHGFRRLTVYSPCRRLADDAFRAEFLKRAPPELTITVPLYGTSAKTHDRVTGSLGSYLEARRAFDALLEASRANPKVRLHVSTVVVTHNVNELAALAAFVRELGIELHPHVPYPMRQTTRDPYAESAVREREIVRAFLDDLGRFTRSDDKRWALNLLGLAVQHPCLLAREESARRLPVFGAGDTDQRPMLPGTEYRAAQRFVHDSGGAATADDAFAVTTVPCPHVDRCALAPICPGEHYAVYQQLFGLDEFEPVSPRALYALRR